MAVKFYHCGDAEAVKFYHCGDAEAVKFYHRGDAVAVKYYHHGDAEAVKSTPRRYKIWANLQTPLACPHFSLCFFVKSVKKTVKDHCSLSCARCLLPANGAKSIYIKRAEQKTLQTLHKTSHFLCILLIIRVLRCVGFEAKILHKPCIEPYMGTKSQRD